MIRRALLRDAGNDCWLEFDNPEDVVVSGSPDLVEAALRVVEDHCRAGGWAAGYLAFEAAAGLDAAFDFLVCEDEPLVVFGLFGPPLVSTGPSLGGKPCAAAGTRWQLEQAYPEYRQRIERIREAIGGGSVYQVNYTTRLSGTDVDPHALFHSVAAGAPFGAWLELDRAWIVSASPELFFDLNGRHIVSSPMKGTATRGSTPSEDAALRGWLEASVKNRAENLMITDMVRNDLGRIATLGSVSTERLFQVQALPTVWQMTSTVMAETEANLVEIFRALFPAASITGAPKIASVRLIRALESSPRGIYTGSIGFVGPAAGGLRAQFNVAIRTARIDADGVGHYGVGGGIVWDSRPEEEYEEACSKARVLMPAAVSCPPPSQDPVAVAASSFQLLETLRWTAGTGFGLLERHLERLEASASRLRFRFHRDLVQQVLMDSARTWPDRCGSHRRVRLRLAADGTVRIESAPLLLTPGEVQPVMLAESPVCAKDEGLRHKTTSRGTYERAAAGMPAGVEAVLWNEEGYVTESVIANVVYLLDGRYFTPPLDDGLLPGVLRQVLIDAGKVIERSLPLAELATVEALHLVNALRGWRQAELAPYTEPLNC